jgi:hypothetical protein
MFQYQKISLNDFTGGITDKYIDGPPNTYQTCVNMDITKFGTLETRRGFKWYLEPHGGIITLFPYAESAGWPTLGILKRPSATDAIIIAQYEDFYILNDEIEVTFDSKNITNGTCSGGDSSGNETNKAACDLTTGTWAYGQVITFDSAHGLVDGNVVYIKEVTDNDVTIAKDTNYYFKNIGATDGTSVTGSLHTSRDNLDNTDIVDFSKSTSSKTFTLVRRAEAALIRPEDGAAGKTLLKDDTMKSNQSICFTEWQGQLLAAGEGNTGTDISRPAGIFKGASARIFRTKTDAAHATDIITIPAHQFDGGEKVIYREMSTSNQISSDDTEYYVKKENGSSIKLFTDDDLTTGQLVWSEQTADGIAAVIPIEDSTVWQGHTLGLPKPCLTNDGSFTSANFAWTTAGSTAGSHLYKCVFKYVYKANDIEYTVYGPPSDSVIADKSHGTLTIPYLRLPLAADKLHVGAEWNLYRVMIEIYRTIDNGSTYYYVKEIPNSVASDSVASISAGIDIVTDANLINNKPLYTTGGMVELWPAPKAKYIISARDITYYCNTVEEYLDTDADGKSFVQKARPNRVYQSVPGIAGSIGDNFYVDVDEDIIGVGEINGLPLIFTSTFIYRLEGTIDSTGAGNFRTRVIDRTIGCLSHASIVSTPRGVFFAGSDGFYQTDGYKINKLTHLLEDSFASITETAAARELINGAYERKEEKIYWGVAKKGSTVPDEVWVLNLRSNGFVKMDALNFEATSMIARDGDLYRGDILGFVYRHSKDYKHDYIRSYNDPSVGGVTGALKKVHDWDKRYIDFKYISGATSFGAPSVRKWVSEATFSIETDGNMGIKPVSINDANSIESDMKEITRENTWSWNDSDFAWGDSSANPSVSNFRWGTPDAITKPRRFPRRESRCRQKQIGLVPVKYKKYLSGTWGTCTLAYSASGDSLGVYTCTLSGGWPENLDGGFIYFPTAFNSLTNKYDYSASSSTYSAFKIIDKPSSTTITFRGIIGDFTGENMVWHIENHALEQRIEIKEIALKFGVIENVEGRFQTEDEVSG